MQHRETQGHESDKFLSYFRPCIVPLEGGFASGFKKPEDEKFETRLYICKGKRLVRMKQVLVSELYMVNVGTVTCSWNCLYYFLMSLQIGESSCFLYLWELDLSDNCHLCGCVCDFLRFCWQNYTKAFCRRCLDLGPHVVLYS